MSLNAHDRPGAQAVALRPEPAEFACEDGVGLRGHLWRAADAGEGGAILVNAATGVLARYYHRYARFLAGHGFDVLTYDYRGIGLSRPERLKGCGYRWRDWGMQDFAAALRFLHEATGCPRPMVVGHSIGGFLPGLAPNAAMIGRMLTVGAQYAWWGDYAPERRLRLLLKWHVAMPVATALCGYFPGRRLGWLEDLPAGVAQEWSFRGPCFTRSHPRAERRDILARMAAVQAPILAIAVTDDELGTVPAVCRALGYYTGAARRLAVLDPAGYGRTAIGHFSLFHDRHAADFWPDTLAWLRHGVDPWPGRTMGFRAP